MTQKINLVGNTIYADGFVGPDGTGIAASSVDVSAGTDGLDAGDLQTGLQAIWTAIAALQA